MAPVSSPANAPGHASIPPAGVRDLLADRRLQVLAVVFALLQVLYASGVTPFHGVDEEEHLGVITLLAREGRLPVLGIIPQRVFSAAEGKFVVADLPTGVDGPHNFQAQHPPLPYLPYAVGWRLVTAMGLEQRWVRLVGLVWGWLTLLGLACLVRDVLGHHPALRVALPAAVCLPGPVYICGTITNDGPAMAAGTWLLWALLRRVTSGPRAGDWWRLGLLLSLAAAVKGTLLVFVPFVLVALPLTGRRAGWTWAAVTAELVKVVALVAATAGWWYLRNLGLYGTPLPRAHYRPILLNPDDVHGEAAKFLIISQTLITLVEVPGLLLSPGWLLLPNWDVAMAYFVVVDGVILVLLLGLRAWWRNPATDPAIKTALRWQVALLLLLTLLNVHQFLFQDFQVSMVSGRYYLTLLGAAAAPVLLGAGHLIDQTPPARAGLVVTVLMVLFSLAWWPIACSPPAIPQ